MSIARSVHALSIACTAVVGTIAASHATAQDDNAKLAEAAEVLAIFTTDEDHGIPADIMQRARGIVVIPNLFRGGFFVGGRRGRGVLAIRSANGHWSNPAFVTLTGGSIGAQFGAESADVVLVFANDRAVHNIASGKFTLGGDAAAVAGPMGRRTTSVMTGRAEVYVYMHTKGLFAGATFEGTRLDVDQDASAAFYGEGGAKPLGEQSYTTPASALPFLEALRSAAVLAGVPAGTTTTNEAASSAETEEAVTFPLE